MAVWSYATERSVGSVLWSGAVGGLVFGAMAGPSMARERALERAAMGDVPPSRLSAVYRAAKRGPVPDDPAERGSAARLATLQLAEVRRGHRWSVLGFVVATLLSATYALASSPWWWFGVPFFAAQLAGSLWLPKHLQRRLALLEWEVPSEAH